jgi:hypothetical protein
MFLCKCDNCGAEAAAREHKEASMKPMFVEPKDWLRLFTKEGKVMAIFCCYNCERNWSKDKPGKGTPRKGQQEV